MDTPSNATILVVEDEPQLRDVVVKQLRAAGYTVTAATDGVEGLHQALAKHPDLILLDIVMPNMDGIEMLQQLREDAWGKDAHVILLTNMDDNGHVMKAMSAGVHTYVGKAETSLESILQLVNEQLGKKN